MMEKINSRKLSTFKFTIIIPILLLSIYLVSCSKELMLSKNHEGYGISDKKGNYECYAIDVRPEFPGGDSLLVKYVAENTTYPKEAVEKKVEGTVYVHFVVDKNGKATADSVMRQVDPLLEKEAIRVVNSMPAWNPGVLKGQAVPVYFIIPVKFALQ